MKLKTKIILILSGVFFLFGSAYYSIEHFIIFPSFLRLERYEALENLQRSIHAIDREIAHIDSLCHDWAAWDDTYDFVESLSGYYIESNLAFTTFDDNEINMLYILDNNGTVVWGRIYDLETGGQIQLKDFPGDALPRSHPVICRDIASSDLSDVTLKGIIKTEKGPLLVASRPILRSGNAGPIHGNLIMARFLDEEMVAGLANQTRVDFKILPQGSEPAGLHDMTPAQDMACSIETVDDYLLHIYAAYPGISGDPAFLIRTTIPRTIVQQGFATMRFAFLSMLAAMVLVLVVVIFLLQRTILKPITRLTDYTQSIGRTGNFSQRLGIHPSDEIGILATEFDRLVETIDHQTSEVLLINERLKEDISRRIEIETALQKANQELHDLATIDGLTQIPNRRRFDEYLALEWKRMTREKKPLSLIICDVDFFKHYNDRYGHLNGDDCLRMIAQVIGRHAKRSYDFAARYGGEEFAIVLPCTDEKGAMSLAESIRKDVQHLRIPHDTSSVAEHVTLSLGLSTLIPGQQLNPDTLIALADKALYEAKETGRNRTVVKRQTPS